MSGARFSTAEGWAVLGALGRRGWSMSDSCDSHRTLSAEGWDDFVFAFRDTDVLHYPTLKRIEQETGLTPLDLVRFIESASAA